MSMLGPDWSETEVLSFRESQKRDFHTIVINQPKAKFLVFSLILLQ